MTSKGTHETQTPAGGTPRGGSPRPAHACAAVRDWHGYFDAMTGLPARETLLRALSYVESGEAPGGEGAGIAIDLGCGEGRDAAELLRRGWRVLAIDAEADALQRVRAREDIAPAARSRLTLRRAPLEDLGELPRAALVNASFALPFCAPRSFGAMWARVLGAIPVGGRFAGQFFGERDGWASLPDRTHHTRAQVDALLADFVLEDFRESEHDAASREHPKHWHVFHVVARRWRESPGAGRNAADSATNKGSR